MDPKDNTLKDILDSLDTITITSSDLEYSDPVYSSINNITLNGVQGATYSNTMIGSPTWTTATSPYTISVGSGLGSNGFASASASVKPSGRLDLKGDDADIRINDWSLKDAVKRIEERLNLLTPNKELETEWEELASLGEQYRKLEQHIKDKMATWEKLKAMPPPVTD